MTDPGRSGPQPPEPGETGETEAGVDPGEPQLPRWERPAPPPVEKSGDPLGGVPIDETVRFAWSPRRGRRRVDDPIPTAPAEDPAPIARSALTRRFVRQRRPPESPPTPQAPDPATLSRSPVSERLAAWRRRYFPFPDEVVDDYLGAGEQVLHADHPAFRSFVVSRLPLFGVLAGSVVLCVAGLVNGWGVLTLVLAALAAIVGLVLVFQRIGDRYTSYVVTNARMIRMSGVVSRSIESIPWVRVTDVGFEQSFVERLLGYATLHIESANETMGLRHMRGIADPVTFNQHLMDMVVSKHGPAAPLGRRSEYNILPEHKSLFGRRRKVEQVRPGGRFLDEEHPHAGTPGPPAAPPTAGGRDDASEVPPGATSRAADRPPARGDRTAEMEGEHGDARTTDMSDI